MSEKRLIRFARDLRKTSTDAERRLWSRLRGERLGGHVFCRQHPLAGYIADFYCHAARLVVELDGGQHYEPDAVAHDQRRTEAMEREGIRVIRFSDYDAMKDTDAVARTILREVEEQLAARLPHRQGQPPPRPSPGVPEEGVAGG
jgi:very-short-patch-repair endonuclease